MFHKTKKLSFLYATLYFLLFSLFVIVLYFSLVKLMENQQINELEDFMFGKSMISLSMFMPTLKL